MYYFLGLKKAFLVAASFIRDSLLCQYTPITLLFNIYTLLSFL